MPEYSYNDIMRMQNDAIRRVNEMQKKAKEIVKEENNEAPPPKVTVQQNSSDVNRVKMPNDYLEELKNFASTSSYFENDKSSHDHEDNPEKKESKPKPQNSDSKKQNDIFKNILGDFNLDEDKALILSLVLLLSEEKADEMLILALLYILQ